jgi:hypothetical protein
MDDWNPNYTYAVSSVNVGPLSGTPIEMAGVVVGKLGLDPQSVRGHFLESESRLRVFLDEGQEVRVDPHTGRGTMQLVARRAVLFQVNALHLNNLKGMWTYVADVFAVALIVLALTGMTMMKGDRGLWGRGKYFVGAGLLLPIAGVIYMYSG